MCAGSPIVVVSSSSLSPLIRIRDRQVEAAVATAEPREPAGEPATLKKVSKLLLHEAGQAFPVAQARHLNEKGLEVIVHNLVRRACARDTAARSSSRPSHARPEGGRRANDEHDEIGRNARASELEVADFAVLCIKRGRRSCPPGSSG